MTTEPADTTEDAGPACPGHRVPQGTEQDRRPAGQPVWCAECGVRIGNVLLQLPEWVVAVEAREDGQLNAGRVESARQAPQSAPRSPSPASDTADSVVRWVLKLEDELLEHLALSRRAFLNEGALWSAIDTLHRHLTPLLVWDTRREHESRRYLPTDPVPADWTCVRCRKPRPAADAEAGFPFHLRCEPWYRPSEAEVVGRRVLRWEQDLRRATGNDDLVHRLPAPCPRCDLLTLIREDGEDRVKCRFCHAEWQEHEYRRLVLVLASTHGRDTS